MSEPSDFIWAKRLLRFSSALGILLILGYAIQPDRLAAVVLVPPWFWVIPAGFAFLLSIRLWRGSLFRVTLVVWVVFLLLFVEQSVTLFRDGAWPTEQWQSACQEHHCLRVVSLNCGDGGVKSLREVIEWKPDLVLIQESPTEEDVRQVAQELFGEEAFILYGWNSSIIGQGELQEQFQDESDHFIHARWKLVSDHELDVVSLRLSPPVARLDFLAPGFWQEHRDRRQEHRQEIEEMLNHLENHAASSHVILGGDFNAPAYDDALWSLNDDFQDTFAAAGRGWGGTGSNESPMFRVDQIWVGDAFRVGATFSVKTVQSDHRMVICDLLLSETP